MPVFLEAYQGHAIGLWRPPGPQHAGLDHLLALDQRADEITISGAQRDHGVVKVERARAGRPDLGRVFAHDLGRALIVALIREPRGAEVGNQLRARL